MIDVIRNLAYILMSLLFFLISFFNFGFVPRDFANYNDIMNSGLSFTAIGSAILILGLSFFPFSKGKGLLTLVYNRILESIIVGTVFYFFQSGLSLLGLFLSSNSSDILSKIFMNLWISVGAVCIIITINILRMILKEISASLK